MKRLQLAHLPTPLEHHERLGDWLGIELWVKRDDCSGGAEAGNKIRKLEYLLADALDQGCDTVITCGGVQSNHARATAICAARLGLDTLLLLRAPTLQADGDGAGVARSVEHAPALGNVMLDLLAGADIRLITSASYERRDELLMQQAARLRAAGRKPYIVPEGGSNGLGALGYVNAMAEVRQQLDDGAAAGRPFDLVVHACGSGGTAAGVALGAAQYNVAEAACAMAVCDDAATFSRRIAALIADTRALDSALGAPVRWYVDDRAKGPAYAVSSDAQRHLVWDSARLSGLILDPVYTGKAMFGLRNAAAAGELGVGSRVLFLHTGGLPGLLAQSVVFEEQE